MTTWRPEAIISGAQTGADRGGLDAAMELGISVGGWVPQGRRAEDGRVPDAYPVTEHVDRAYPPRTRANIDSSNATVIFCRGEPSGGSRFTETECVLRKKPCLVIDVTLPDAENVFTLREWLNMYQPKVLNVAGSRESHASGLQAHVKRLLVATFTNE